MITSDAGRIMDDGTVARLDEEQYYVTTTSTGADAVYQWFTWWNAVWVMDVQFHNVTGAVAAVNVAGPKARDAHGARVRPTTSRTRHSRTSTPSTSRVAGVPTLALRIGFVGELGYELHFPSPHGEHVWDALLEQGADLGVAPSASSRSGSSGSRRAT